MMKGVALLVLLGLAGVTAQTNAPLLDAVTGNPQLSLLAGAIQSAGLADVVNSFNGTVFAPTNAAFTAALAAATAAGVDVSNQDTLAGILAYHLVPGAPLFSTDLTPGDELPTASPDTPDLVVGAEGDAVQIISPGSTATIIRKDIRVGDNVVVHIIDAVLLPLELTAAAPIPAPAAAPVAEEAGEPAEPTPTPVETYRTYTSVVDALTGEGLDLLAAVDAADLEGAFGPSFNGTVFAPSNAALMAFLETTGITLGPDLPSEVVDALTDVLAYHVIPGTVAFSADLAPTTVIDTLAGLPLTIYKRANGVFVEGLDGKRYRVTTADIEAGDAVVHVIDGVLLATAAAPGPAPVPSSATSAVASMAAAAASLLAAALVM